MTITKKLEIEEENIFLKSKRLTVFVVIGLVSLIVMEIWVSHTTAIFGVKFKELQDLQGKLTLENQILEDQIASASALKNIASSSAELGLAPPSDIQYIK